MSFFDYGDDDMVCAAQSCKLFNPKSKLGSGRSWPEVISCSICSSWNGRRCGKRVLDNTLSVPELE